MEYTIEFQEVEINYIIIRITPSIQDLTDLMIECFLNCKEYKDFTIERLDDYGTIYKITPTKALRIYDEISIHLKGQNIYSNDIKIYLCKEYRENKGLFVSAIPTLSSGKYDIGIDSLNDTELKRRVENQVICNGINEESSYIKIEKESYNVNENINLNINIFDNANTEAPDGSYFIYVKIEEIT